MAEFATNNNKFISTKLSPFFTSRGIYPYINFDIIDFLDIITHKQINKKKTIDIIKLCNQSKNMYKNL